MKTDIKNCPSEADIEHAFKQLDEHRRASTLSTKTINDQIQSIDNQVDEMIADLMEQRAQFVREAAKISEPHDDIIEQLTDEIKEMVLENGKTCSTIYGTCTHVKGRKGTVKWDDAALNGAIAGNSDLDFLLGFRVETPTGKAGTRFKLVDLPEV